MTLPPDAGEEDRLCEPVEHEAAKRARPGQDVEAVDVRAVELDERRSRVARLRRAVDDHRRGDPRQRRRDLDRVNARSRDVELDRVRAGQGVGVIDRLAERPGSAVGGVRHGERIRPGGERAEEEEHGREEPGWVGRGSSSAGAWQPPSASRNVGGPAGFPSECVPAFTRHAQEPGNRGHRPPGRAEAPSLRVV